MAAILKTTFTEHSNLLHNVVRLSIRVWRWENVSVMKEYDSYTFHNTFMDSECAATSNVDMNVALIMDASWILSKISSLSLSVSLVVWRDDDDFLAKISKSNSQFVNHNSKTTDS